MTGCPESHLDGAYVLGALAPAERAAFEAHLATCAECAAGVRRLAGLPGLLARVDPADLDPVLPPPPPILPALVREVTRRTRRRRWATAGGLAAAAVLALTVSLTGAFDGSRPGGPPAAVAPVGRPMAPVGQHVVTADVAIATVPWGTRLDLTCSYARAGGTGEPYGAGVPGPAYSLVVVTRSGRTEKVASWHALEGRTMHLTAATATPSAEIAGVEIRNSAGVVVLRLAA